MPCLTHGLLPGLLTLTTGLFTSSASQHAAASPLRAAGDLRHRTAIDGLPEDGINDKLYAGADTAERDWERRQAYERQREAREDREKLADQHYAATHRKHISERQAQNNHGDADSHVQHPRRQQKLMRRQGTEAGEELFRNPHSHRQHRDEISADRQERRLVQRERRQRQHAHQDHPHSTIRNIEAGRGQTWYGRKIRHDPVPPLDSDDERGGNSGHSVHTEAGNIQSAGDDESSTENGMSDAEADDDQSYGNDEDSGDYGQDFSDAKHTGYQPHMDEDQVGPISHNNDPLDDVNNGKDYDGSPEDLDDSDVANNIGGARRNLDRAESRRLSDSYDRAAADSIDDASWQDNDRRDSSTEEDTGDIEGSEDAGNYQSSNAYSTGNYQRDDAGSSDYDEISNSDGSGSDQSYDADSIGNYQSRDADRSRGSIQRQRTEEMGHHRVSSRANRRQQGQHEPRDFVDEVDDSDSIPPTEGFPHHRGAPERHRHLFMGDSDMGERMSNDNSDDMAFYARPHSRVPSSQPLPPRPAALSESRAAKATQENRNMRSSSASQEQKALLNVLDYDFDGKVSKAEIFQFMKTHSVPVDNAAAAQRFQASDKDHDGFLNHEELPNMLRSPGHAASFLDVSFPATPAPATPAPATPAPATPVRTETKSTSKTSASKDSSSHRDASTDASHSKTSKVVKTKSSTVGKLNATQERKLQNDTDAAVDATVLNSTSLKASSK